MTRTFKQQKRVMHRMKLVFLLFCLTHTPHTSHTPGHNTAAVVERNYLYDLCTPVYPSIYLGCDCSWIEPRPKPAYTPDCSVVKAVCHSWHV